MRVYAFDLMPWPHLTEPSYYPDANARFDPVLGRQVYAEHLDQMVLYERHGFDAIGINEHHSKPYGLMPSPNLIAAALTQRTSRIKIALLGNLPALHAHPVRLAEEVAMLERHVRRPHHLRLRAGRAPGVPRARRLARRVARAPGRGVGADREGVDHPRAVRVARQALPVRARVDLAAAAPAAAPADRAARGQRRGARAGRPPARGDGRRVSLDDAGTGRLRALPPARRPARLDATGRGLPRAPPRLRRRDERAGAGRGGAAPRVLLAEAPELSPGLREAPGPGPARAPGLRARHRGPARSTRSTST